MSECETAELRPALRQVSTHPGEDLPQIVRALIAACSPMIEGAHGVRQLATAWLKDLDQAMEMSNRADARLAENGVPALSASASDADRRRWHSQVAAIERGVGAARIRRQAHKHWVTVRRLEAEIAATPASDMAEAAIQIAVALDASCLSCEDPETYAGVRGGLDSLLRLTGPAHLVRGAAPPH